MNKIGWMVVPFLTLYLTQAQHLQIGQATLATALVGLGSFIFGPVGGILADQVGCRRTLLISLSLTAAITLTLGLVRGVWLITSVAFILGCVSSLYGPAASALLADIVEPPARVARMGFSIGQRMWGQGHSGHTTETLGTQLKSAECFLLLSSSILGA